MAFLEDPRLRQRWNQITHDAEAVTENAAAGIWTFQHNYINPCLGSITNSIEQCTSVCLGDPEERLRRRRERERARAEYNFDFYDDWYAEEENGGLLGSWSNEDWDRLLAGTGASKKHTPETSEQPRRKRGMSYGTRPARRKTNDQDPTIIPSTQPIGFLSRLPWKMGGTLRYKPSIADLQDNPHIHGSEGDPLLGGTDEDDDTDTLRATRKRSGTTGSGDTSDSYRSRGDLFPSDGEGEEDAVALDDEVTYDMVRMDAGSAKSGRRQSKGKSLAGSRTVSRTTLGSVASRDSLRPSTWSGSMPATPDVADVPSLETLEREEQELRDAEDEEVARKRTAAAQLAAEKGLDRRTKDAGRRDPELKPVVAEDEDYRPEPTRIVTVEVKEAQKAPKTSKPNDDDFVPARLPRFS